MAAVWRRLTCSAFFSGFACGLVVELVNQAAVVVERGAVAGVEDEQDGGDGVAQGVVGRVS